MLSRSGNHGVAFANRGLNSVNRTRALAFSAGEDATAISQKVARQEITATEIVEQYLDDLDARDSEVGAVWLVTRDRALREAATVDEAIRRGIDPGPLSGVPVGWKDLIDTGGIRTTYGSEVWRNHVPERDADVVARFTGAGAITLAKLATHELAWGTTTDNPWFGTCRNPHDTTRTPGGSSGGSAAAVASGSVALAAGTDTGGSIRIPAAYCGVVGLKPTYGRVSLGGVHPLAPTLDVVGPIAQTVRDCALALEVLAGATVRDPRTSPVPVDRYREAIGRGVKGLKIGIVERFFEDTAADIANAVRAAIGALSDAGAQVVETDLAWPPRGLEGNSFYRYEEGAAVADVWPGDRDHLGPEIVSDLQVGERLSGLGAGVALWRRMDYAGFLTERMRETQVDLVATPTAPFSPPKIGTRTVQFLGSRDMDISAAMCTFTRVFNVLGWPAISVPCGIDDLGLPVGLQLAALPWRESDCLAAAAVLHP